MNKKRYRTLFEIREATDPRTGAVKRQAVYTGPYYRIDGLNASRKRLAALFAPGVAVYAGILLGYLFTDLPSTRFYLTLPFALAMPLPLMYWALAVWRILRLPERFTEVQRDHSLLSCIRSAYGLAALGGLFATGAVVLIATGGAGVRWPAEAAWATAMAAAGGAALWSARQARRLDARRETENGCSAETPHSNKTGN